MENKTLSMVDRQSEFASAVARLVLFAIEMGYQVTFGDAWAKEGEGRRHKTRSLHYDRLALDLNLFKDGVWLTKTADHTLLGLYWKAIGGVWGGRFGDGNHYEWRKK